MATAFEERQVELLEATVLEEVKVSHEKYFKAVSTPPRLLVGTEVPSLTGPGNEKLRDSTDAKEWQDTVKELLLQEVASQVEKRKDGMRDVFTTVHASIDLFRNNNDLIPGTREFDKELADAFVKQVKDYELRADGKLIGYSVPVQPIINVLRSQIATQRAAAAPPAAQPKAPGATGPAPQPRRPDGRWDGPQAGLTSKAGQSSGAAGDDANGLMDAFFRQNGMLQI